MLSLDTLLKSVLCGSLLLANASFAKDLPGPIRALANDYVVVYESPDAAEVYCYSPGIIRLDSGRLVATLDLGGKGVKKHNIEKRGKILTSDDKGKTWTLRGEFNFVHARPFVAGKNIYVLGQGGDLKIVSSKDNGENWSETSLLTKGQFWHQSACNVHYANGNVYLVMERRVLNKINGWAVGELAPVLMRAKVTDDLMQAKSWTFASELTFQDALPATQGENKGEPDIDYFGVPFYPSNYPIGFRAGPRRFSAPIGWLETNVVQFVDPKHIWHDPKGKTFHLWARSHTGGTGYAAIAKVVEKEDGSMVTELEKVPSGVKALFLPCPGGHMKFHVLYDEKTKLYWLLSSQATDSMTIATELSPNRFSLPNNERHRLQLHFSTNMVDWCFAGLVATGETDLESRHYASMVIDGDDLHVLSRSGDKRAKSAHDGNIISFHTIPKFRELVY